MSENPASFADLGLPAPLLESLAEVGYETPSPIQAACIPILLDGRDLLGEAQTGTGKTAAFALPMLARLDLADRRPQLLVLAPTRELAIQVSEAFQKYAHHMPGFHVLPVYGGQSMVVQLRGLQRGPHVVVGTPGRVMDHLERESLRLDGLRSIVLDEADEMLRMGFIDDVEWILQHTPPERQTALFSATMPEPIRRVAHNYLRDPREVKIRAATATVSAITQRYWTVRGIDKLDALTRILEAESELDAAIVFVRTKLATEELAQRLEARGHAVAALNGDMTQGLRERVIEQLRSGGLDIVVATDVAARGIDVPRVSHVINYDIPYDTEAYVHRIGRTGRAGRSGTAILFVAPRELRMLRAIERATRQTIEPIRLPTRADLAGRRVAQFKQLVLDALQAESLDFFREIIEQIEDEEEIPAHDIAAALAFLAQRERPLQLSREDYPDEPPAMQERPQRERAPRDNREQILERRRAFSDGKLVKYWIGLGRQHGVTPKEIVGAIANEGGIDGRHIGQINLFDRFSTVELPADMSGDLIDQLKRIRIRQQALALRPFVEKGAPEGQSRSRPQQDGRWNSPSRGAPSGDAPPRRERPADKKPYGQKFAGQKKPRG